MMNTLDISNGFDLSQTTTVATTVEVFPSDFGPDIDQNVVVAENFPVEKNCQIVENDLFMSLKVQFDSQNRLIQFYQSRIRSFERFCKYCQRVAQLDGDDGTKFDPEQFRNEYNRFNQNYRYWRKRIRKLRKQTKFSLAIRYQNPYDALYELFSKIESFDQNKENLNNNESSNQIYPEISLDIGESPTTANGFVYDAPVKNNRRNSQDKCIQCDGKDFSIDGSQDKLSTVHSGDEKDVVIAKTTRSTRGRKPISKLQTIPSPPPKPTRSIISRRVQISTKKKVKIDKVKTKLSKKSKSVSKKTTAVKREISRETTESDSSIPEKPKTKKKKRKPKTSQVLMCEVEGCKYSTTNSWYLKVHKVVHSTDRPFKCDRCEMAFKSKTVLNSHQNVHEGKRFECTFEGCTVNYATKNGIRDHIRIVHTKEAPLWQCSWEGCKYSTYDKEYFQVHQKVHTGERPYKCPECDMAFKSISNLGHHKLIHKNELKFKCTFEGCTYATYRSDYLKSHVTVHSDERSFKCIWPGCGQTFKTSSSLWCHKMMHENQRRYKCSFDGCDYACNLPGNIQTHEELVHKKSKKRKGKSLNPNLSNITSGTNGSNTATSSSLSFGENAPAELVNCIIGSDIGNDNNRSMQIL